MYGAVLGDMIGSPYEFDSHNIKSKEFPLFSEKSEFTDDTVMTLAVAGAFLECGEEQEDAAVREVLIRNMKLLGNTYPLAGYGADFSIWLSQDPPVPYNSFGNGAAMRVSAAAWLHRNDFMQMRRFARLSAEVSHNHPEGIRGAEAVASVIFLAVHHWEKEEIRKYVTEEFGYDLNRTCDEIRPDYHHVESCQETVPQAIIAFLEGNDFEDVVRTAVSLGGDSDTLAAIAGSMAEAYYGVPEEMKKICLEMLPEDLRSILLAVEKRVEETPDTWDGTVPRRIVLDPYKINCFHEGNESIEELIEVYRSSRNKNALPMVFESLRLHLDQGGRFLVPVRYAKEDEEKLKDKNLSRTERAEIMRNLKFFLNTLKGSDGRLWQPVFTSSAHLQGKSGPVLNLPMDLIFKNFEKKEGDVTAPFRPEGILVNPFTQGFSIPRNVVDIVQNARVTTKIRSHIYFDIHDIRTNHSDCIVLPEEGRQEAAWKKEQDLPSRFSLYVPTPRFEQSEEAAAALLAWYESCMEQAKEKNLHSIAFPTVYEGVTADSALDAAAVAVRAVSMWMAKNHEYGMAVVFSCRDEAMFQMYQKVLEIIRSKNKSKG